MHNPYETDLDRLKVQVEAAIEGQSIANAYATPSAPYVPSEPKTFAEALYQSTAKAFMQEFRRKK